MHAAVIIFQINQSVGSLFPFFQQNLSLISFQSLQKAQQLFFSFLEGTKILLQIKKYVFT